MRTLSRVCVYCGSNRGNAIFVAAAREMGRTLAERGIGLVYGGGRVGLMGEVADAALKAGGEVIGVIPEKLMALELGHTGCTELRVVPDMHTRKTMMADLSDGFVAMPGGFGTLEELFEVTTWTQLNYHLKPVGILNVDGFYDPLLTMVSHAAAHGFIRPAHRHLITSETTASALLDALETAHIPLMSEWIDHTLQTQALAAD
ncbi:MAG: hypothetical protein ACJATT_001064 [Myxococcota bacterium]